MKRRANLTCLACRVEYEPEPSRGLRLQMCHDCAHDHFHEREKATRLVTQAKYAGRLLKATAYTCVDCGKAACHWDHRDYTKPLDVVPVCRSCNFQRPTAFNSTYRPAAEHITPETTQ